MLNNTSCERTTCEVAQCAREMSQYSLFNTQVKYSIYYLFYRLLLNGRLSNSNLFSTSCRKLPFVAISRETMFTFESYPTDICESQTVAIATALEEIMWNLYRLNERIFSSW